MCAALCAPLVSEVKTPQGCKPLQGLSLIVVGAAGFEPATSCSQNSGEKASDTTKRSIHAVLRASSVVSVPVE